MLPKYLLIKSSISVSREEKVSHVGQGCRMPIMTLKYDFPVVNFYPNRPYNLQSRTKKTKVLVLRSAKSNKVDYIRYYPMIYKDRVKCARHLHW